MSAKFKGELNPFVIRGHHLQYFAHLITSTIETPANLAEYVVNLYGESAYALERPEYTEDVIGKSQQDHDVYRSRLTDVFTKFTELALDHTVTIVSGRPDAICGACIAGDHCHDKKGQYIIRRPNRSLQPVYGNQIGDMHDMARYRSIRSRLVDAGDIDIASVPNFTSEEAVSHSGRIAFEIDEGYEWSRSVRVTYQPTIVDTAQNVGAVLLQWRAK